MPTEDRADEASARAAVGRFALAVALVTLCWILGTPRSGGPDEPSHMVASAGLVRGEGDGEPNIADPAVRVMDVPAMVGAPDPVCWAFDQTETAGCTDDVELSDDTAPLTTTSYNYPAFGLLLPGIASYVPWAGGYAYLARALGAVVPVTLVAAALAMLARRGRVDAASALLALSPIAWFTFGVVNPSGVAIAGGLALCVGCLLLPSSVPGAALLASAGWLAVMLPRRDGPLWASLVVVAVCAAVPCRPLDLWRWLPRGAKLAVALAVPIPILEVLERRDFGFNAALAAATILLPVVDQLAVQWSRSADRRRRGVIVALVAGVLLAGSAAVLVLRPGGYDANLLGLIVGNTGSHLTQLVGILGWLNAPVPTSGVVLHWAAAGGLVAVALTERPRSAAVAVAGLLAAVVLAWLLELGQGATYGQYWQGRYSMPLVVALPVIAAWRRPANEQRRLGTWVVVATWWIANLAFFAAQRRWAVGNGGTWYVWRWNTWEAPLPPMLLLIVHAAATAWLSWTVFAATPVRPAAR